MISIAQAALIKQLPELVKSKILSLARLAQTSPVAKQKLDDILLDLENVYREKIKEAENAKNKCEFKKKVEDL